MFDIDTVRSQFPAIANHPEVIYFDNAATTQKPRVVLDAVASYHHLFCANTHRSTHDWGLRSTQEADKVRNHLAEFLGLSSTEELFFNSGATGSSEKLALHFCAHYLEDGDEIIISENEHITILSSWKQALKLTNKSITIKSIVLDPEGDYNIDDLKDKLNSKTKLVVLSHVHNVFGVEMGIEEARKAIPLDIPIILDAAQSVGHMPVNVKDLGVQAIFFSAHKMFGLSGIGAMWLDKKYHHQDMIFEQGTLNIEGVLSLGAAMKYIESLGLENIERHLLDLTQYALQELRKIPGIEFLPGPAFCICATGHGILSFRKQGVSSQDLAQWLNEHQIYVRAGEHCSQSEDAEDSVRLSLQVYNCREEIDKLCKVLEEI